MSENSKYVAIVANHTREMTDLLTKYNELGRQSVNLLNDNADYKLMVGQLKKENKELKKLLEVKNYE